MKDIKYLICRDDIYVGEVVKTDSIHRLKSDMFYQKAGQLDVGFWKSFRSMLFVPYNFKVYKYGKEIINEEEIYELYKKV